jgi:hypothetical protein
MSLVVLIIQLSDLQFEYLWFIPTFRCVGNVKYYVRIIKKSNKIELTPVRIGEHGQHYEERPVLYYWRKKKMCVEWHIQC